MVIRVKKGKGPGNVATRIRNLMAGFATLAATENLDVLGNVQPAGTILAALGAKLVPYNKADAAHQALTQAVADRDTGEPDTEVYVTAVEKAVESHLGSTSPKLENFGMAPKTPAKKPTPTQRLARTEKARATRAANAKAKTPPTGGSTPTK